ncbi:hypothetical protein [Streptomyces prunicolor]|uniref:hypothetical protein n=1 Tax=Streptomyces prunicolor TaxID=67348 RepID=UPI0003A812C4|nr:hypothetical protein [Streptomyces prunicolor]
MRERTPGAPELGVRTGDDVLLTARTGRGPWADLVVAEHIVRTQPRRAFADLAAWVELVDLLDHWANLGMPVALELLGVVVQFADPAPQHSVPVPVPVLALRWPPRPGHGPTPATRSLPWAPVWPAASACCGRS